jgi:hypothetical protein
MLTTTTTQNLKAAGAILAAALAALAVQAGHLLEHMLQLGYWFAHPAEPPWMTPWAMNLAHRLAVGGNHALGIELLHLIGNLIFLAGLTALALVCRRVGHGGPRNLRIALTIQTLHVVEHTALTSSVILAGQAVGVSTFFGLVDGQAMTSWRVWFHFLINLAASWYTARALLELRRTGVLAVALDRTARTDQR